MQRTTSELGGKFCLQWTFRMSSKVAFSSARTHTHTPPALLKADRFLRAGEAMGLPEGSGVLDPDQIRYYRVQYLQYEHSGLLNPPKRPPAHMEMNENTEDTWRKEVKVKIEHLSADFSRFVSDLIMKCALNSCIINPYQRDRHQRKPLLYYS